MPSFEHQNTKKLRFIWSQDERRPFCEGLVFEKATETVKECAKLA